MSVLDKFLNAMKLNDDDEFDDSDYLDEEIEEDYEEIRPRRRFIKRREEEELEEPEKETAAAGAPEDSSASRVKQQQQSSARQQKSSKISPIRPRKASAPGMEVCMIKPHSMEDAKEITETLLANCTVVLNMEGLEFEIAQRIFDFSCGSCYAVEGKIQKISNYIFILTPSSVDISGDFQDVLTGVFDVPSFEKRF